MTLSNCLIWEPDLVTSYYTRDDSLLLILYDVCPQDRIHVKDWKSSYGVMPDFSNWLDHFTPDFVPASPLYDIDDHRVGAIREKVTNLLPNDGAIIKAKQWVVGETERGHVTVIKDDYLFGLKNNDLNQPEVWI